MNPQKISIKEKETEVKITVDDTELQNIISYSISSDTKTTKIILELEIPKTFVTVENFY